MFMMCRLPKKPRIIVLINGRFGRNYPDKAWCSSISGDHTGRTKLCCSLINMTFVKFGIGVFGRGFGSMDAAVKRPWTDSQHPLTETPVPEIEVC